jgi:hypothetical protein
MTPIRRPRRRALQRYRLGLHLAVALLGVVPLAACHEPNASGPGAGSDDPSACQSCHPSHVEEWSSSAHAHASEDPVFRALNRLGQEETNGALGDFCVRCHAPLALRAGTTTNGLELAKLEPRDRGVSCAFCHRVSDVPGHANGELTLDEGGPLRAGIADPRKTTFHDAVASPYVGGDVAKTSRMCGACHDVVLTPPFAPAELALERTYAEWQASVFAPAPGRTGLGCGGCHVPVVDTGPVALVPGAPVRSRHGHDFFGVDLPLVEDAPGAARQAAGVQAQLDTTLRVDVCVTPRPGGASSIDVTLENVGAGHAFPSGAAHTRRAWVEVKAYAAGEMAPVYVSGVGPDDREPDPALDADLWELREIARDADGRETDVFWRIASLDEPSRLIPPAVSNDPSSPDYYRSHVTRTFPHADGSSIDAAIERVTVRVRLRAFPHRLLQELVSRELLDPAVSERVPTLDLLPNRHLSGLPGLEDFGVVTFAYGPATRDSGLFAVYTDTTRGTPRDCQGMVTRRR